MRVRAAGAQPGRARPLLRRGDPGHPGLGVPARGRRAASDPRRTEHVALRRLVPADDAALHGRSQEPAADSDLRGVRRHARDAAPGDARVELRGAGAGDALGAAALRPAGRAPRRRVPGLRPELPLREPPRLGIGRARAGVSRGRPLPRDDGLGARLARAARRRGAAAGARHLQQDRLRPVRGRRRPRPAAGGAPLVLARAARAARLGRWPRRGASPRGPRRCS